MMNNLLNVYIQYSMDILKILFDTIVKTLIQFGNSILDDLYRIVIIIFFFIYRKSLMTARNPFGPHRFSLRGYDYLNLP